MKYAISRKNVWDKLPATGKRVVGAVLGLAPLPWLLGRRFRRTLALARAVDRWPIDKARRFQLTELRRVCTLAYERSRFYRRLFDEHGVLPEQLRSLENFERFPLIDKSTIRDNLEAMCTRSINASDVDEISTGGTGGQPLYFYIDAARSAIEYAYLTASWERAGYRVGMLLAVLRGRIVTPNRSGVRHEYDPLLRNHYFSNFHTTDADFCAYMERIRRIGPCFLHAYPSSAVALARYHQRGGIAAPSNIRGIMAESEIVYPDQRALIQDALGQRLFACYGQTEKLVLAAACEHSEVYHVWPTYGYFELLDEDGRPVTTPGQRGEIVGTGFINTVVPFIRYRTGDYATYVGDHCDACGRQHVLIEDIQGHRTQEFLVTADGSEISWTALNMHDDTFRNVRQFQFYQDTPGRATLRIVPAEGFGEADRQRIVRNLARKLDGRLDVAIELTGAIHLSARGKTVYVDQRIRQDSAVGTDSP
ncbi:MAG: phenylacetate--CoA ligase family protein [Planctomycetes bacterium]|nr:phenylacetate--CoA ligase family protein [Planctomycetota bacterium]